MKEKNPNGEGSLRQRKDGRWEFRVKVEGRNTPLSFYSKDKDGRGAKIAHESQATNTHQREQEKKSQVPLPEEPV